MAVPRDVNLPSQSPRALDRVLGELRVARTALDAGEEATGETALAHAFAELGTAYAHLGAHERPEVTARLLGVYDLCVRYIGAAAPGRTRGLTAAIALLAPVRDALAAG